jgi:hypothetical protein
MSASALVRTVGQPALWRSPLQIRVVGSGGDRHAMFRQDAADRLDPETGLVIGDAVTDQMRGGPSSRAKKLEAVLRMSLILFSSATSRLSPAAGVRLR